MTVYCCWGLIVLVATCLWFVGENKNESNQKDMLVILQQEKKDTSGPNNSFWLFGLISCVLWCVYGLLGCCGGWMCGGGVGVVDGHVKVAVDVCGGGGDGGVVSMY